MFLPAVATDKGSLNILMTLVIRDYSELIKFHTFALKF